MKISLYFIFYVAMILELLIFILERDEAADQHLRDLHEMLQLSDNLAQEFGQPLDLNIPPLTTAFVYTTPLQRALGQKAESTHVVLSPVGLWSVQEREEVTFTVLDSAGRAIGSLPAGGGWSGAVAKNVATGNAMFNALFEREGSYRFTAVCEVKRSIPAYYPDLVRDSVQAKLRRRLGTDLTVRTARAVPFTVVVRSGGRKLPPCEYCGQGPYKQ